MLKDMVSCQDIFGPPQCKVAVLYVEEVAHTNDTNLLHDDVIKWKHFPHYWPFVWGIHCVGNSPFPGEFPSQRPVTRSFDVFFDLRLNKWLSKEPWGWWFETPSCSLWRHVMTWTNLMKDYCHQFLWHSFKCHFTGNDQGINHWNYLKNTHL